jgi:hypothetical protein
MLVCQTRDISREGCFLDTLAQLDEGAPVTVTLMDPDAGDAVQVGGTIMRALAPKPDGSGRGVGIHFEDPPDGWLGLVARHAREHTLPGIGSGSGSVRLRIVVVGDEVRRRGALALYVTSGWDVRFASDLNGMQEALSGVKVDAVIAEHDLGDQRWTAILGAARDTQPETRRIVRSPLHGQPAPPAGRAGDLVHRVVDQEAGLEALLDALTADFGETSPAPTGRT